MVKHVPLYFLIGSLCLSAALTGCRADKQGSDNHENVHIATPFGGMSVKTDEAPIEGTVGLSVYPGATLIKDHRNDGAADINMSFGNFHLGVKALTFHSDDAPDKVTTFYRKDMARYGAVLLCQQNRAIGQPDHTQNGLTCNDSKGSHVHVDTDDAKQELKAGSRLHQHIVSIDPDGTGTKIALVALDLPGSTSDPESGQGSGGS